ncbi:MAG TPA: efflux RND transporter permease subunit, partial [Gemmata sp.]|nr:efflux RND transporter permease subunit [Gemmata sp.]
GWLGRRAGSIQRGIDRGIGWYTGRLDWVLRHRLLTLGSAAALLIALIILVLPILRREFFPETDAGTIEIFVRTKTGTRIEATEAKVAEVEEYIRSTVADDLELTISEIGVWADWSAAYTPNAGPMDAVVRVQLRGSRKSTAQEYARRLREGMIHDPRFATLEFAFNTGGAIRGALNEGRSTPINIQISGTSLAESHAVAMKIRQDVVGIDGVVDTRIMQRLDYPGYIVDVDRAKARELGLTQRQVMENVVAAIKSSIQFNKRNFWIDPDTHNQYYVGVQYPEQDIKSLHTLLNVSITSPLQPTPIPLSNFVNLRPTLMAAEVTHTDLMATIDISLNVEGRDLGHVADDIRRVLDRHGQRDGGAVWRPFDPEDSSKTLRGTKVVLSGEYGHMLNTFKNFAIGLSLAVVFIYFLMVVLLDSYLIPLVIMAAVPLGLVGVIPMLWATGTAINVQSLLGVVFMVGIIVSNTVLLVDFAQHLRGAENLTPVQAIRRAAEIRARPVMMTALAALLALTPMALALEQGSEANAPLGRAVIGGLIAGLCTTLLVVPAFYSLVVRPRPGEQLA